MNKLIYLLFIFIFLGCQEQKSHPIDFYYWRSNYSISTNEKKIVNDLNVKNIYVRFFDVDKNDIHPKPIGLIKNFDSERIQVNYIPTIFITNRTFAGLNKEQVVALAKNVNQLIIEIA